MRALILCTPATEADAGERRGGERSGERARVHRDCNERSSHKERPRGCCFETCAFRLIDRCLSCHRCVVTCTDVLSRCPIHVRLSYSIRASRLPFTRTRSRRCSSLAFPTAIHRAMSSTTIVSLATPAPMPTPATSSPTTRQYKGARFTCHVCGATCSRGYARGVCRSKHGTTPVACAPNVRSRATLEREFPETAHVAFAPTSRLCKGCASLCDLAVRRRMIIRPRKRRDSTVANATQCHSLAKKNHDPSCSG